MSNIDKQALREAAEKATQGKWSLEYGEGSFDGDDALIHREIVGYMPICKIEGAHPESGFDEDFQMEQQANAEFIAAANPRTMLALLDENIQLQREKEAIEAVALALRDDMRQSREKLEAAERRIAEQSAIVAAAEKLVRCKGRYHSELNYRALAKLFGVITPDLPPLEHENVHYADAAEVEITALRQRIAELEAREIKPVAWMRNANVTSFMSRFTTDENYAVEQWGDDAVALYSLPVDFIPACFTDERNLMHINERGRETSLIWSERNSEDGDIQLFRAAGIQIIEEGKTDGQ